MSRYRFEKKYRVEKKLLPLFLNKIYEQGCQPLYHKRYINNLYFDDNAMTAYHDNIEGFSNRIKTRFRWYGDKFGVIKVTAEKKIKHDDVNRKISAKLGEFQFHGYENIPVFEKDLVNVALEKSTDFFNVLNMNSTLLNRYYRAYFLNFDKTIRITIDTELEYYSPITKIKYDQNDYVVIEIKTTSNQLVINNIIPYMLTKSSKYCNGIIHTNPFISNT